MNQHSKTCTKCNTTYKVDNIKDLKKYFYKSGKNDGKLRTVCKECLKKNSRKTTSSKNNNGILTSSNGLFIKKCTKCENVYTSSNIEGFSEYFSYLNKDNKVLNNICKHCKNKVYYNKYTLEELVELQNKLEEKLKLVNEVISERTKSK